MTYHSLLMSRFTNLNEVYKAFFFFLILIWMTKKVFGINHEVLLLSTGNYIQQPVINIIENNMKKNVSV